LKHQGAGVYLDDDNYDPHAGLQFIEFVRREVSDAIPIVIMTNERNPKALLPSFDAGADDFIMKGEGLNTFVTRFERWLHLLPTTGEMLDERRKNVLDFLRQDNHDEMKQSDRGEVCYIG
jgi:DNA-binding NarL/FixJ family response regulator